MSKVEYNKDILEAGYWLTDVGNKVIVSKDSIGFRYWGNDPTDEPNIPASLNYPTPIPWIEGCLIEYQLPFIFFI